MKIKNSFCLNLFSNHTVNVNSIQLYTSNGYKVDRDYASHKF